MTTDTPSLIRAAAVLTNSYVASSTVQIGNSSRVSLDLDFTLASLTSIELVVEVASGSAWRALTVIKATSGTVSVYPATFTLLPADWGTSATSASILLDVANAKIRVKARGNGTLTSSSLAMEISEANAA